MSDCSSDDDFSGSEGSLDDFVVKDEEDSPNFPQEVVAEDIVLTPELAVAGTYIDSMNRRRSTRLVKEPDRYIDENYAEIMLEGEDIEEVIQVWSTPVEEAKQESSDETYSSNFESDTSEEIEEDDVSL